MLAVISFSFLAFGSILAVVGCQVVFRCVGNAIKNLCVIIGLTVFSLVSSVLRPATDMTLESREMSAHAALMIIPIILGAVAYKGAMRFFQIKKT